jgi:anti-sigma-K factor RskA
VSDRERLEELAALQALGLLQAGDSELNAWLGEAGPEAEALAAELKLAASALAFAAKPVAPRPEVKEKLLTSLGPTLKPADRRPSRPVAAWLALAAAALVLAAVGFDDWKLRRQRDELFGRTAELSQRLSSTQGQLSAAQAEKARQELTLRVLESEDVKVLFLGGKDPQPSARAKVFWSEKAKRGVVLAGNLAPLPPDKQYELWVFDKGKPVPAGVFDADATGRALFESADLSAISAAQNFAVTVEPKGGVPAPTGPIVLLGASS